MKHLRRNNRHIAGIILALVTIGFMLCHPFRDTFAGGLLTALFGSSMIGGIADWFGITALFRKPLGIPFRTELIPRNREKIFDSLVSAVEDELLTKEAIMDKLGKFDVASRLINFLDEQDGKKELSLLAGRLVEDMLEKIDPTQAGAYLGMLLDDNRANIDLSPMFINAADWLSKNIEDERIISCVAEEVKELDTLFPEFGLLIGDIINDIYGRLGSNAEKETAGRGYYLSLPLPLPVFPGFFRQGCPQDY